MKQKITIGTVVNDGNQNWIITDIQSYLNIEQGEVYAHFFLEGEDGKQMNNMHAPTLIDAIKTGKVRIMEGESNTN